MSDLNISMILRLVDKVTAPAKPVLATVRQVQTAIGDSGNAAIAAGQRIDRAVGQQAAQVQRSALGLAGIGASLAGLLKPAVDFEAAMDRVGAVSRAEASEMDRLSRTARDLGASTNWSATEAAGGMQELAMAGFEVNDIISAMPGMLSLASAGQVGLAEASDIASSILSGFTLQADETGRVADVMTNTFTGATVTLGELGETMKYVAPNAAAVGLSMETVAAMTGKLGDAGIRGSMAGTALRAMISRLSGPTGEASKALAKLGVETVDTAGNLRPMGMVLSELDASMQSLGTAQQASLRKAIFGEEASAAAQILMVQSASGSLSEFEQALHKQGSAAQVAEEQNDNFKGLIKQIGSLTEAVGITVGTVLLPALTELVQQVQPVLASFNEWAEANPELVKQIGMVVAGLVGFKLAIFATRIVFMGVFGPAGTILKVLGWLLKAVRFFNPFSLMVAAVIGLAVAIYRHWDEISAYLFAKWDAIVAGFDQGWLQGMIAIVQELNPVTLISDAVAGVANVVLDQVKEIVGQIHAELSGIELYDAGIAMIQSLWDGAKSLVVQMVADITARIRGIVPDRLLNLYDRVTGGGGDDEAGDLPPPVSAKPISAQGGAIDNSVVTGDINVHVKTDASPQDIAAEVSKAVQPQQAHRYGGQPLYDEMDNVAP